MSLYENLNFSELREIDLEEASYFYDISYLYDIKIDSFDMLKEILIANNPKTLSNGVGAFIRGNYVKSNILQPYKYNIEYLLSHDLTQLAELIQLSNVDYYYNYNIILTFYYAGFISDHEKINHPEFKRLVSLPHNELIKWGRLLRLPVSGLNKGQILSKILETNFTINTVENARNNVNNIKQERFGNIVDIINNNHRSYIDLKNDSLVPLFDDNESLPLILVQNYQDSSITFSIIPIKAEEPIDLNDALYVDDGTLVFGRYFYGYNEILNADKVAELLNNSKMELIRGNNIYNLYILTKDMLTGGQYDILLPIPDRNTYYADKNPINYKTFIQNLPIPDYLKGSDYFRPIRKYISENPDGLVLNSEGTPILDSYPNNMAIVIFRQYNGAPENDVIFVWLTAIINMDGLDPLAIVHNPSGYPMFSPNKLSEPLNKDELHALINTGHYYKFSDNNFIYFYMIDINSLIKGDYPVPLPDRSLNNTVMENI